MDHAPRTPSASTTSGTSNRSDRGSSRSEVTCEPCDPSCLDKADEIQEKDRKRAAQLASRACDVEKCGHLGTAMVMRCREYGLLKGGPVSGPVGPLGPE